MNDCDINNEKVNWSKMIYSYNALEKKPPADPRGP